MLPRKRRNQHIPIEDIKCRVIAQWILKAYVIGRSDIAIEVLKISQVNLN